MPINFICYLVSNELGSDGGRLVDSGLEGCVWHGRGWTETDGSLFERAVQTCNPVHLSTGGAFASETSDMPAQAVAYNVEILQSGSHLRHEEIYQFRYVRSHYTCVRRSVSVVRNSGEHSPIDPDDVVIASSQISWKENSTWLQSLLVPRYYIIFPSGVTVWLVLKLWVLRLWLQWILRLLNSADGCNILWYGRQVLAFRRVMLSTFQGRG